MNVRRSSGWKLNALAACACAALWLGGCGQERPVVVVPVPPEPVPISLDQVIAKAKAGETDWQIIWALRQSRRALPLTTADVGRLREAGVSDHVIDFTLETVTAVRLYRPIPMTMEEVIGLKAAGVPDEAVIAEIAQTETVFYLLAADVFTLREQGVSDEVIDFMLYTRQLERTGPRWRPVSGGP
jgi:hypothetical protein